jgi:pro-sigmaK processing inhibitor BofA
MIEYLVGGIVLLFLVALSWELIKSVASKFKTLLLNSLAGILILLFLKVYLGWGIPMNPATLLICGLFGLPGIGTVIILHIAGMI